MALYTFWEGQMPDYVGLCLKTWKQPYILLNYANLHEYTDLPIDRLKRFTLPQIADCVRVHVLRDQGGYWLDADTIMITGELPETDMVGDPERRTTSIGLLRSDPGSEMFKAWSEYQDSIIDKSETFRLWSLMGNSFTDPYLKAHAEIKIIPIEDYYPELKMVPGQIPRYEKYQRFYFDQDYHLSDLPQTSLLMLHNSWTPKWYKELSWREVMAQGCTMSNILRELL